MSEILVPYFELYIGGYRLTESWLELVQSIVFEDTSTGSDLLTITLADPDLDILNSNKIFIEEQQVSFVGGYLGNSRTLFNGFISVIDIDFPESGETYVTIVCMDGTHLMNREEKTKVWQNKKVSDVATEIIQSYGFKAIVDDTVDIVENISQSDETDADFLSKQAGDLESKYLFYVTSDGTGHFVKKLILDTPQDILTYKGDDFKLMSFSPRITKEKKREQIKQSDLDAKTGAVDTGKATESIARDISGSSVATSSSNISSSNNTNNTTNPDTHIYQGNGVWS